MPRWNCDDDLYYVNVVSGHRYWVTLARHRRIVGGGDWHWLNIIGAGMALVMNGAGLAATRHELGHKVSDPETELGRQIMVALLRLRVFMIEATGAIWDVSTGDPAFVALWRIDLQFVLREIPSCPACLEAGERAPGLGLPFWSRQTKILQSLAITLLAYGAILAIWGVKMLPFLAYR